MACAKADGAARRGVDPGVAAAAELRSIGLLLLAGALAAGAYARLAGLGDEGLWLDEGWSLWFATRAGVADLLRENHPPLYYLILRAATRVADSDVALRATGTIASAGSVTATWLIARRGCPGSVFPACVAAALVAVAGVDIDAARELRMYAWTTLAFALALLAALAAARGSRAALAGVLLASVALLHLHGIGGFFVAGALAFGLAVAPDRRTRGALVAVVALAGLLHAPWFGASTLARLSMLDTGLAWQRPVSLGSMLNTPARLFVDTRPPWIEAAGAAPACTLAMSDSLCRAAGFTPGSARGWLAPLGFVAAIAVVAIAACGRRQARGRDERALLTGLVAACAVPYLLLVVAVRAGLPFWDVRYLSACTVPAALLVAAWCARPGGVTAIAPQAALVALVATFAIALPQQRTTEQWREAAHRLLERRAAGEWVLLNMLGQGGPLLVERYARDPELAARTIPLREHVDDQYGPRRCGASRERACLETLVLPADAPTRTWMLRSAPLDVPRYPFDAALRTWLDAHFVVEETEHFRGIELLRMRRRDVPTAPGASPPIDAAVDAEAVTSRRYGAGARGSADPR